MAVSHTPSLSSPSMINPAGYIHDRTENLNQPWQLSWANPTGELWGGGGLVGNTAAAFVILLQGAYISAQLQNWPPVKKKMAHRSKTSPHPSGPLGKCLVPTTASPALDISNF